MNQSARFLTPSEAARRLGVSAKALRLYERHGLLLPDRTAAGWRAYGPETMARAAEIVALRTLGLSLAQVARALAGDARDLAPALAAHQDALEARLRALAGSVRQVRAMRAGLATGTPPAIAALARLLDSPPSSARPGIAFDLPWPWGGERFQLGEILPLTYIIGPLGSGKTRFAERLAETLPGGAFLGLDRLADEGAAARARLAADPVLAARVEQRLAWLAEEGAVPSPALVALLAGMEAEGPAALVVDMVEQGLDQPAQGAVIAHLRRRCPGARPLFLLTRSAAILDLDALGADEAVILCPANHSPPTRVAPWPGAPGYEAVATCLAAPAVRARTEGMIAWRPEARRAWAGAIDDIATRSV